MEYYSQAPLVPRKPAEYTPTTGSAATMNELLGSLSLDEDPSQHYRRGHVLDYNQGYEHDDPRMNGMYRPAERVLPDTTAYHNMSYNASNSRPGVAVAQHSNAAPATPLASLLAGQSRPLMNGEIRETMSRQREVMLSLNDSSSEHTVRPSTASRTTTASNSKWPQRKPIEQLEASRSYYSPDDLDRLLAEQPRTSHPIDHMSPQLGATTVNHQRSSIPEPQASYEGYSARDRYSTSGQPPHTDNYRPELVPTPSTSEYLPPSRVMYQSPQPYEQHAYAQSYGNAGENSQNSTHKWPAIEEGRRQSASFIPRQNMPYAISEQVRLPSPPQRQETISPEPLSRASSGALHAHPALAPTNRAHASQHVDSTFSQSMRADTLPLRSMSSMSNNSQRSPERQQRHPISELEIQYGGRIPSPDRSLQFPDNDYGTERAGAESVPPQTQMRRGRPKGEFVQESDLPAMPLLFHSQHDQPEPPISPSPSDYGASTMPFRAPTRTGTALSTASGTSASPTRANNATASNRSKQHAPPGRESDLLQSIKGLPIRPIKCPALCLEERFHPSSFAKTNKFRIKVHAGQTPFVAGGEIFGHIDIISDEGFRAQLGSTQVLVGEIGVEVIGYEEIQHTESGHNPRSLTFLFSRKVFQPIADTHPLRSQEEHVLTSAVLNDPPPDKDGYRTPSKGTTSFPFAFPLPVDCPSSADIHVARIKYLITGYATVKLQGSQETIATSQSIRVVEAWDVDNPVYSEAIEGTQGRDIANYQEIAAVAKIGKSLFLEGQIIQGSIRVVNHSSKKIREVKFFLVNKITLFGDKRSARDLNPPEDFFLEETVVGHSEPHVIPRGGQEEWIFSLLIPADRCISIRNSALFEVTPFVLIKISTGPLNKSTRVNMPPISIANQHSMLDGSEKKAPVSDPLKWSNLPQLYRSQRVIEGRIQGAEKGTMEQTNLVTYIGAHHRVMLLSAQQ